VDDSALECMFYVPATCTRERPTPARLAEARSAGFALASYGESPVEGVTALPLDPRTAAARALARALRALGAREALIYNARETDDLAQYLRRSLRHSRASADWPAHSRWLDRKLAHGATLVVLLPPGTPPPEALRASFPNAVVLEDARYARPVDSTVR
jgi:hypothetical protein